MADENTPPEKSGFLGLVITRDVVILLAGGLILFLLLLLWQANTPELKESIFMHGGQAFALSLVEAGLLMLLIEKRASREQVSKSLALIEQATKATTAQVQLSTEATARLIESSTRGSARLTQQAIDSLFDAFYRKKVPAPIIDLYEQTAFKSAFFRTGHTYTCTFQELDPVDPNLIHVTFHQTFAMLNLTDSEQSFNLACESQLPASAAHLRFCEVVIFDVENRSVLAESIVSTVDRPGYRAQLVTHPERIGPRQSRKFTIEFTTVRRRNDFEVVMTSWPSDGISLLINSIKEIEVTANALHPHEMKPLPAGGRLMRWSLDSGFVPGQGVCLIWEHQ